MPPPLATPKPIYPVWHRGPRRRDHASRKRTARMTHGVIASSADRDAYNGAYARYRRARLFLEQRAHTRRYSVTSPAPPVPRLELPARYIHASITGAPAAHRDALPVPDTFTQPYNDTIRLGPSDMTLLRWIAGHGPNSLINSIVHRGGDDIPAVVSPDHEIFFPLASGTRLVYLDGLWYPLVSIPNRDHNTPRIIYVYVDSPGITSGLREMNRVLEHCHYDQLFIGRVTKASFVSFCVDGVEGSAQRRDMLAAYLLLSPPSTASEIVTRQSFISSHALPDLWCRLVRAVQAMVGSRVMHTALPTFTHINEILYSP